MDPVLILSLLLRHDARVAFVVGSVDEASGDGLAASTERIALIKSIGLPLLHECDWFPISLDLASSRSLSMPILAQAFQYPGAY